MGNTRGTQGGAGALNTALSPNVTVRQRPREGHPCRHRGGGGGEAKAPRLKAAWQLPDTARSGRLSWAPDLLTALLKVLGHTPREGTKLLFPAASEMSHTPQ